MGGGGNIETEKGFIQLLARLKLDSEHIANLISHSQSRRIASKHRPRYSYGVPTFSLDNKLFWGFDRTDMLLDYLKEPGMLETTEMKRLAIEEGIFCGRSTGLNVVGAINLACEIGSGRRAVTLGCDTGLKYLGGHIYP